MKMIPAVLVVFGGAWLTACSPARAPAARPMNTAKIVDAIKIDEVHWNADWKSGSPAVITAHYAPGAVLMVPGAAPRVGAPAIQDAIGEVLEDAGHSLTFASDKIDVAASGDLAVARGTYSETTTDPATKALVTVRGVYVTVYKPVAKGAWKAVWDINTPGAPAKAVP